MDTLGDFPGAPAGIVAGNNHENSQGLTLGHLCGPPGGIPGDAAWIAWGTHQAFDPVGRILPWLIPLGGNPTDLGGDRWADVPQGPQDG